MSMTIDDIATNSGKNTIVLTKYNGKYKIFTQTDTLLDATRELVTLYKKTGKTNEQLIKLLNLI